eukprot:9810-Heterococcus_DN1.PRE.1
MGRVDSEGDSYELLVCYCYCYWCCYYCYSTTINGLSIYRYTTNEHARRDELCLEQQPQQDNNNNLYTKKKAKKTRENESTFVPTNHFPKSWRVTLIELTEGARGRCFAAGARKTCDMLCENCAVLHMQVYNKQDSTASTSADFSQLHARITQLVSSLHFIAQQLYAYFNAAQQCVLVYTGVSAVATAAPSLRASSRHYHHVRQTAHLTKRALLDSCHPVKQLQQLLPARSDAVKHYFWPAAAVAELVRSDLSSTVARTKRVAPTQALSPAALSPRMQESRPPSDRAGSGPSGQFE